MKSIGCFVAVLAVLMTASAMAQPDSTPPRQPLDVRLHAVRIGVNDLDAAVVFYTRHLGCEKVGNFRALGFEMLDNQGVSFVLTQTKASVTVPADGCHTRVNFEVEDLDAHVAGMKAAGVEFVDAGTNEAGRCATFLDPAGNRHSLNQSEETAAPAIQENAVGLGSPRVRNLAISVPSMKQAADFYHDVLGFEKLTRDDAGPVAAFKQKGSASFILSEEAKQTAPYIYAMTAHVGFALETSDLAASVEQLKSHGVTVLHDTPQQSGNVMFVGFSDPFGNMHELIQYDRSPERTPPPPSPNVVTATLKDLEWMSGRWVCRQGDDQLEETWAPPLGDTALGMFRWVREGKTWMYEMMTIEPEAGGLVFRLRHFGRQLKPWEKDGPLTYPLKSLTGTEAVFEHPTESDPKRFIYRRQGDRLFVRLEAEDVGGEAGTKADEFQFDLAK